MKQVGFSYKLMPSESDFSKLAIKFNILLVATLLPLWITRGEETEFIDFGTKVTFRAAMGLLSLMMAFTYWSGIVGHFVYAFFDSTLFTDVSSERIRIEMAMVNGFLCLTFLLMHLYGFFWGFLCLPISPPSLLLCLQFVKTKPKKAQD